MLLSDVCLSVAYIGPNLRTERPMKINIGTEVAHVIRVSRHHFQGQKVKGQGHQAALLTAALSHEAGAAVTVRTYWAWETATLRLLGGARGAGTSTGRRGAGAYRVVAFHFCLTSLFFQRSLKVRACVPLKSQELLRTVHRSDAPPVFPSVL